MKSKKCFLIIFCISFFWVMFFSNKSFAGTQKWNNLDYDVTVNSDGSMDVVETWDIYISETNTLFKDFNLDSTKYSGISNVSVMQTYPEKKELEEIYEEQYHVDSGCFYGLKIDSNTFEIAWNVGLDDSSATRTYQVRYRINNAVKIYNDCTELYWMFLDTTNTVPAKKVTGTVKLPKAVSDIEKLRVWGHGPLNANINKKSKDTVVFDCENFDSKTMLEIRIVTEENIYSNSSNKYTTNKLDSILAEEQKWADEANNKRKAARTFMAIVYGILVILAIFIIKKYMKYIQAGKELDLKYARNLPDLKYFRDIPNEKNATPVRAAYLYYLNNKTANLSSCIPQLFSATMLDLALKKYIEFEPIDNKNFSIILKKEDTQELSSDEAAFYNVLKKAAKGSNTLTTKDLLKYSKVHYESLHSTFSSMENVAKSFHRKDNNFDSEREKENDYWTGKSGTYMVVFAILFILGFFCIPVITELFVTASFKALLAIAILFVSIIGLALICSKNAKKVSILSDKGAEEQLQWKGLKNYMKEFSLLKDKEVPDLILWEKFLVYATAFGISKEVIKQLKIVYPELSDPNYYQNNNYTYMFYMSDSRFGDNFINTFDNAMVHAVHSAQNAYSAAHSSDSSGSGGGGGFSGGGGGGGGGGRSRRSLIRK